MGHYASEMGYPPPDLKWDRYCNRLELLQKQLKRVPLSKFTVGEFGALMKLTQVLETPLYSKVRLKDEDFKILEKKVRMLKKPKPTKR